MNVEFNCAKSIIHRRNFDQQIFATSVCPDPNIFWQRFEIRANCNNLAFLKENVFLLNVIREVSQFEIV